MPKWSAATSTTSRAAPTTSGPMPSPGSNNISNELRMILLELRPRLKPRPPAGTQSVRQKLLGPRLIDDLIFFPERVDELLQEPFSKFLEHRRAEQEEQVLERHLIPCARRTKQASDGEPGLPVYPRQVLVQGQIDPAGDGRCRCLRDELTEPGRCPHDLPPQQEGVCQLVPEGQGQRGRGVWPERGRKIRRQHQSRRLDGTCEVREAGRVRTRVLTRRLVPILVRHEERGYLGRLDGEYLGERPVALREIAPNLSGLLRQPWSVKDRDFSVQAVVAWRSGVPSLRGCYGATCASHLAPTMPAV